MAGLMDLGPGKNVTLPTGSRLVKNSSSLMDPATTTEKPVRQVGMGFSLDQGTRGSLWSPAVVGRRSCEQPVRAGCVPGPPIARGNQCAHHRHNGQPVVVWLSGRRVEAVGDDE